MSTRAWSAERVARLHQVMAGYVERGDVPGLMDSPTPPGVFQDLWTTTYQALGDGCRRLMHRFRRNFFRYPGRIARAPCVL
jgi:hypothetical protein